MFVEKTSLPGPLCSASLSSPFFCLLIDYYARRLGLTNVLYKKNATIVAGCGYINLLLLLSAFATNFVVY